MLPVLRHADNAVFFWNDDRRAHNLLETLDFAEQTWLPSLRLGLNFGRHGLVVHKPPYAVPAPRSITHPGPSSKVRLGPAKLSCQAENTRKAHSVVAATRCAASQLTTHTLRPTHSHRILTLNKIRLPVGFQLLYFKIYIQLTF